MANYKINKDFLKAVATHEGFYINNSVAQRYHNPGNLVSGIGKYYGRMVSTWTNPLSGLTFGVYKNDEDGWADLEDYISETIEGLYRGYRKEAENRGKKAEELTLAEYFGVYAPVGWENFLRTRHKPNIAYATSVSKTAKIPLNSQMRDLVVEEEPQELPSELPNKFLIHPIDKVYITQKFGERPEVYKQFGLKGHNGIDYRTRFIDSPLGKRYVTASMDGKVIETGNQGSGGYGIFVRLQHRGTEQTIYGHLKATYVVKGQSVKQGMLIGLTDNTGFSSAPHLHFSWRKDGWEKEYSNGYKGYSDPLPFIKS